MLPSDEIASRINEVKYSPTPAKIAPNGASVMHDTMNENATTPVRLHATYAVDTSRWYRMSPFDWPPVRKLNGGPMASVPNTMAPTTSAVMTTRATATHAQNIATTNFENTRRPRPTGRMSRYRRLPQLASPAMASPPNNATTITSMNALVTRSAKPGSSRPVCDAR